MVKSNARTSSLAMHQRGIVSAVAGVVKSPNLHADAFEGSEPLGGAALVDGNLQ